MSTENKEIKKFPVVTVKKYVSIMNLKNETKFFLLNSQ